MLTVTTKLPETCSTYLFPPLSLGISKFASVTKYHAVRSNTRHLIKLHAFFASLLGVKTEIAFDTEDQNCISIILLQIFLLLIMRKFYIIIIIIIIIGIQLLGRSGQRPEFSQATGMALVRCILGKFLGVACHCFPPLFRCSHFSPPGASTSATT